MFSRLKNFSPWFVPACCVYATVYEETKCDKVVKGLRTCSSGQNASSAANCTQWCHGTLDFSPFTFWLLHRGSFSPEGETNRRSCAVHADNYLRSLPPYCFLNNRLPISISWLLVTSLPFSGPAGPPTQLPFEGMHENKRILFEAVATRRVNFFIVLKNRCRFCEKKKSCSVTPHIF